MFKKIKDFFELHALYKKSKKVLIINAASAIASVKDIAEMAEKFVKTLPETDVSSLKEDLAESKYMSDKTHGKEKDLNAEDNLANKID